ncbi:MAG: hypothetical protein HQL51_02000 [Magnetococcales bacterium]|nr:hypothetical protein [Magnetococcales bacterium]
MYRRLGIIGLTIAVMLWVAYLHRDLIPRYGIRNNVVDNGRFKKLSDDAKKVINKCREDAEKQFGIYNPRVPLGEYTNCLVREIKARTDAVLVPKFINEFNCKLNDVEKDLYHVLGALSCYQWASCGSISSEDNQVVVNAIFEILLDVAIQERGPIDDHGALEEVKEEYFKYAKRDPLAPTMTPDCEPIKR